MTGSSRDITGLLREWSNGDQGALAELIPLVYHELRKMAGRYLRREHQGHTLQTTGLVHEAYLRLIDQREVKWQNRGHFFAVAAQAMRRILVDYARREHALKRGAREQGIPVKEEMLVAPENSYTFLALDDALSSLASIDPRQGRIVELRFFAGLTLEETAEILEISPATVKREWNVARAWLYREISGRGKS